MQVPGEVRGSTSPLPPATSNDRNFQQALTAGMNNGNTAWPVALSRSPNPDSVADAPEDGGKGSKTQPGSIVFSKSGLREKLEELFGPQVRYTPEQVKKAIDDLNEAAALEEVVLAPGEDVLALEDVAPVALTGSIVGMPVSTIASSVDAALRQAFGIPDDVPSAAGHVVVLSNAGFLDVAGKANVKDAPRLNAFIVWNSDGTVRMIAVREGAEDPETLAHELLHAYTAPAFASMAESFRIDPDQPYSNLGEGVVDFLVWLFMGDDWQAPCAQGADIARQIFEVMDAEVFHSACFLGDESAVDAFRQKANSFTELTVVAEEFPIIQAKVQGVGDASSDDPSPSEVVKKHLEKHGFPTEVIQAIEHLLDSEDGLSTFAGMRDEFYGSIRERLPLTRWSADATAAVIFDLARAPDGERDALMAVLAQLKSLPSDAFLDHLPAMAKALHDALAFGDPGGRIYGQPPAYLSAVQRDQITAMGQELLSQGFGQRVVTAIERVVAAQPSAQGREDLMLALQTMPDAVRQLVTSQIPPEAATSQQAAQASAAMVAGLAPVTMTGDLGELESVISIVAKLDTITTRYQLNSPLISGETRAWVMRDVTLLPPEQRTQFGGRIEALDPAQLRTISSYLEGYGGQVEARMMSSLIWMEEPYRTQARRIIFSMTPTELTDRLNAAWNVTAAPLEPEKLPVYRERERQLLSIFNSVSMPDVLRNYVPDARPFSPMDRATSIMQARAEAAMHVPDGAAAAAEAILRIIRERAFAAYQSGSTEPIKLTFLGVTGFSVPMDGDPEHPATVGTPETDGPPGLGWLMQDLQKLNTGTVKIQIRNGEGKAEEIEVQVNIDLHYVVDEKNVPVQEAVNTRLGVNAKRHAFPSDFDGAFAESWRLLNYEIKPDVVFFTERPGANSAAKYTNMSGIDVGAFNAPLDMLLTIANNLPGVITIAVGDGGNEAGTGRVNNLMPGNVLKLPAYIAGDAGPVDIYATTGCQYPVTASISNLGSEAVIGFLLKSVGRLDEMHTQADVAAAITAAHDAGAIEGVTRDPNLIEVDHFTIKANQGLRNLLELALRTRDVQAVDIIVFDSSSGAQKAANTLARVISELTGLAVNILLVTDNVNAPYGPKQGLIPKITNDALKTAQAIADKVQPAIAIGMVCNTACTSGIDRYAAQIAVPVSDLITVTSNMMIEYGDSHQVADTHQVVLATVGTAFDTEAYSTAIRDILNPGSDKDIQVFEEDAAVGGFVKQSYITGVNDGRELTITEIACHQSSAGVEDDWATLINEGNLNPDSPVVQNAIRRIVDRIQHYHENFDNPVTSIWLNCTHYPAWQTAIEAELASRGLNIPVIDPMPAQARALVELMRSTGIIPEADELDPPPVQVPGVEYAAPPKILTTSRNLIEQVVTLTFTLLERNARVFPIERFGPNTPARPFESGEEFYMFGEVDPVNALAATWGSPSATNWRAVLNALDVISRLQARVDDEGNPVDAEGNAVWRNEYNRLLELAAMPDEPPPTDQDQGLVPPDEPPAITTPPTGLPDVEAFTPPIDAPGVNRHAAAAAWETVKALKAKYQDLDQRETYNDLYGRLAPPDPAA